MMQGESIKLGFWMEGNSLVDLLCVISCFVELYVIILLFEQRERRRYTRVKVFIAAIIAIIMALVPYFLHYNYLTLMVWFSSCLLIAIVGVEICFAEYILLSISHIRCQNGAKKSCK